MQALVTTLIAAIMTISFILGLLIGAFAAVTPRRETIIYKNPNGPVPPCSLTRCRDV